MITIKIQGAAKDTGRNLAKRISEIVDECGHEAIAVKANEMYTSRSRISRGW